MKNKELIELREELSKIRTEFSILLSEKNQVIATLQKEIRELKQVERNQQDYKISLGFLRDYLYGEISSEQMFDLITYFIEKDPRSLADAVNLNKKFPLEEEIVRLLWVGEKIPAIKKYREVTGFGLKKSKEDVEAIVRKYELEK